MSVSDERISAYRLMPELAETAADIQPKSTETKSVPENSPTNSKAFGRHEAYAGRPRSTPTKSTGQRYISLPGHAATYR